MILLLVAGLQAGQAQSPSRPAPDTIVTRVWMLEQPDDRKVIDEAFSPHRKHLWGSMYHPTEAVIDTALVETLDSLGVDLNTPHGTIRPYREAWVKEEQ